MPTGNETATLSEMGSWTGSVVLLTWHCSSPQVEEGGRGGGVERHHSPPRADYGYCLISCDHWNVSDQIMASFNTSTGINMKVLSMIILHLLVHHNTLVPVELRLNG